jgi:hypothetical protein
MSGPETARPVISGRVPLKLWIGTWTVGYGSLNGGAMESLQISLNARFELGCDAKAYEIQKDEEGEVLTYIPATIGLRSH